MKDFIKSVLSAQKGSISSKRVCGCLGFLISIGVLIYCTVKQIEAPQFTDAFTYTCAALLGVDSITRIWKKQE